MGLRVFALVGSDVALTMFPGRSDKQDSYIIKISAYRFNTVCCLGWSSFVQAKGSASAILLIYGGLIWV